MSGIIAQIHNLQSCLRMFVENQQLIVNIEKALVETTRILEQNKPLLVCGNGGSAMDSSHIAGELVGRFLLERKALPVIALSADNAIVTAMGNDYGYEFIFSRQVEAYAKQGGVLWAISTSGNSANVLAAVEKAKQMGVLTVGFTGEKGGKLAKVVDVLLAVPSSHTPRIQEMHIVMYHYLCEQIEKRIATNAEP